MSLAADLELGDTRLEFMADYILKTMKLKTDKWQKMYSQEENKAMFMEFLEKSDNPQLIVIGSSAGALSVQLEWPQQLKGSKAVYFVRKRKEGLPKDSNFKNAIVYGDLSYAPMDQLSAFVDEVSVDSWINDQAYCIVASNHLPRPPPLL